MNKLPVFHSNKKYWMILNKLVFGDSISCPECKSNMKENYKLRYLWCSLCRKKYRSTAYKGNWLYGMKLSPKQLFVILWCWQYRKSPDTVRILAQVSYTTVQRWYERFRDNIPPDILEQLSMLIQVDESYFGKRKSFQDQVIVTGAIEPYTRKIALQITGDYISGRTRDVLEQFIQDTTQPGTLVVTDKWYAYNELNLLGYEHEIWNHSTGQFAGTNQIEGLWSSIKRYLRKLYGCIPTKNLKSILTEWMARQNRPSLFISPENYLRECLFHVS